MTNEILTPEEAQAKIDELQARVDELNAYLRNAKRDYHKNRTIAVSLPELLAEKREAHGRIVALRQYVEGGAA